MPISQPFNAQWLLQFTVHKSLVGGMTVCFPASRFRILNLCSEIDLTTSTGAACCSALHSRGRLPQWCSCWLRWTVLRPSILTSLVTWTRKSTCRSMMPRNCHWCHFKITSLFSASMDGLLLSAGGIMVQWQRRERRARRLGNATEETTCWTPEGDWYPLKHKIAYKKKKRLPHGVHCYS